MRRPARQVSRGRFGLKADIGVGHRAELKRSSSLFTTQLPAVYFPHYRNNGSPVWKPVSYRRAAAAKAAYLRPRVSVRPYGRALAGVRLRTPGPIAPVFQPRLVPVRPIWKWGAGLFAAIGDFP